MCLIPKGKFKIADKDIVVYKVLEVMRDKKKKKSFLCSVFNEKFKWKIKKLMFPTENPCGNDIEAYKKKVLAEKFIGPGMFHTFKYKAGAKKYVKRLGGSYPSKEFPIYECVIPKGTEYIKGVLDNECFIRPINYCSFRLIVRKRV